MRLQTLYLTINPKPNHNTNPNTIPNPNPKTNLNFRRTIMTPIVLDFSYFNCSWMWLHTLNIYPKPIPNPNLKTNPNSTPKSEDLNMVVLGF